MGALDEPGPWTLVWFDGGFWTDPPLVPPKGAELAQDKAWCSFYDGHRAVATWNRSMPVPATLRRGLADAASERKARGLDERARRHPPDTIS